jgi:hypothetical protein
LTSLFENDTAKSKLKSERPEEYQGKVQPMRVLNASSVASGAREIATNVTSRCFKWSTMPLKLSAQNEQLLHASFHEGLNMKW